MIKDSFQDAEEKGFNEYEYMKQRDKVIMDDDLKQLNQDKDSKIDIEMKIR